ncbi:MAG TPA: hypothetical protein PLD27_07970 [bacterium]|nr:hypothetical protein [bacterium]HOL48028.1 hypothetical protein [bacterium]HPQ19140.1 hypothetical protein [bacterium]
MEEKQKKVIILDTHNEAINNIKKRVEKYKFEIKTFVNAQDAILAYMKEFPYIFIIDPFIVSENGTDNPELGLKILEQFSLNNLHLEEPVNIVVITNNVDGHFGNVLKKMGFEYMCNKIDGVGLEQCIEKIIKKSGAEVEYAEVILEVQLPQDPVKELLNEIEYYDKDELYYLFTEYPKLDVADPKQRDQKKIVLRNLMKHFWTAYQFIALDTVLKEKFDLLHIAFLRFRAILSLDWLSANVINSISNFIEKTIQASNISNIFYADEYLKKIWAGELLPSYNDIIIQEFRRVKDMFVMLRDIKTSSEEGYLEAVTKYLGMRECNMLRSSKKTIQIEEEELMNKGRIALFGEEIINMLKLFTNMCIGPQGNKLPILNIKTSENFTLQFTTKEAIKKIINEIKQIDENIFKRVRLNEDKKFQEYNIEPYVIILPCISNQGVCWDAWHDANKRTSPGRIGVPIIYERTLEECVLSALAHLKWRTAKSEADIYWMEEGLTGHYYQYFEENKKKKDEDGNPYVASTAGPEESFVCDYITWLKYEAKGQLKLRKEVRDMFWILIPFSEKVKAGLAGKGQIYEELLQKDKRRAQSRFTSLSAKEKENNGNEK